MHKKRPVEIKLYYEVFAAIDLKQIHLVEYKMASDLTAQVLDALHASNGPLLSSDAFPSIAPGTLKGALDSLGSREMVTYRTIEREESVLSEEAKGIVANGSHEAKVFEAVRQAVNGLKITDLPVGLRELRLRPIHGRNVLIGATGRCRQRKRKGRTGKGLPSKMDQERREGQDIAQG